MFTQCQLLFLQRDQSEDSPARPRHLPVQLGPEHLGFLQREEASVQRGGEIQSLLQQNPFILLEHLCK